MTSSNTVSSESRRPSTEPPPEGGLPVTPNRRLAYSAIQRAVQAAEERLGISGSHQAAWVRGLLSFDQIREDTIDEDTLMATIREACAQSAKPAGLAIALAHANEQATPSVTSAVAKPPGTSGSALALGLLAARASADRPRFCEPGTVLELSKSGRARVYILAPPREESFLKKDLPSRRRFPSGDGRSTSNERAGSWRETYLQASSSELAFCLAPGLPGELAPAASVDSALELLRAPFPDAPCCYCPLPGPSGGRLDGRPTGSGSDATPTPLLRFLQDTYLVEETWRRIDGDWLATAEQLALDLDRHTNNTSLVLAFEWGPPSQGRVLLFAADAQVGNWLSWRRQIYQIGGVGVTADDLLRRTVLYKVGHHGSHNATLRCDPQEATAEHPHGVPFGLELMDGIIAMLPVDYDAAQKPMPNAWDMPHRPLYERLREKASRRVLRSDEDTAPFRFPPNEQDLVPSGSEWSEVPGMEAAQWRTATKRFESHPRGVLYYDVQIGPD